MSTEWQVKVHLTQDIVWQGMIVAGSVYNKGLSSKLWAFASGTLPGFFAPLGLIMTAVAIGHVAGFDARETLPWVLSWPLLILLFCFAVVCFWVSGKPWKSLAKASVHSTFNQTKHAQINAGGFTLTGGSSHWQTGWSEVAAVLKTEDAIVVVVSAIALLIPRNAFASPEDAELAYQSMQRWQLGALR